MSFWSELKRRNVYKVGIAYAIVAWLILQVAAITFPTLNLPGWALPLLTVLIIVGFPLVLIFAWAFEITPEGIKKAHEVPHHESITHITGQKLNYILTLLLVVAVGFILVDNYFLDRHFADNREAFIEGEAEETNKTIAVLPFVDLSPDSDQGYFVDGLSEELLNSLAQIPDLKVTARTSSFIFKGSDKKIQEIAEELGVANILEGSVRKAGTALRITAQLIRAADGFHLWSKSYNRELKDIFTVQEDIATTVAGELKATLGVTGRQDNLGGTNIAEAYEHYLVAQGQYKALEPVKALESINAALALDPEYALAWAFKSTIHNGIAAMKGLPSDPVSEHDAALKAAERAIELAPDLPAGYYSLGFLKTCQGDWIGAETAYRRAIELIADPSLTYKVVHPYHYFSVGNIEMVMELSESSLRDDPLNKMDRCMYVSCLIDLGEMRRAEEENERVRALFGDEWAYDFDKEWLAPIDSEDFISNNSELMQRLKDTCLWLLDDDSREQFKSPKEVLDKLGQCASEPENQCCDPFSLMRCAAFLGDPALAITGMAQGIKTDASATLFIWEPLFREMRQLPEFKELVREVGLVDYWNKFGWPDLCHPLGDGDFVCD